MTTFKQWVKDRYDLQELQDIANHGCVSGCAHGAIYYHETIALYDKFEAEIWQKIRNIYQDFGSETPLAFIASLVGAKNVYTDTQFKNLLAWFYIEEMARDLSEEANND